MKFNQTKLAVAVGTAAIAMAGALVAPQAAAHSKADRAAQASDAKVRALEAQMNQMRDMMSQMQSDLASAKMAASQPNAKVQELDDWMQSVKSQPVKPETRDNMVFFRGGYSHFDNQRGGTLDPTSFGANSASNGLLVGPIAGKDAWYFGAGFDFSLSPDLWGFMDNTEVLAELGVNYTQRSTGKSNGLSPQETAALASLGVALPAANTQSATVNMATVSASPKIKFLKGSAFRPWLIPVGFELNVISPPSDAITVLTPGMVFGAGVDYKLWKDLYVGADVRYHYAPGSVDGVDVNNFNAGGYVGLGF